ncbi:MAG: hypothetical protein F4Y94_07710, partial [Chloroflexi bacterium]|nr:hypothetical protein [Chloroflexota bacterium]
MVVRIGRLVGVRGVGRAHVCPSARGRSSSRARQPASGRQNRARNVERGRPDCQPERPGGPRGADVSAGVRILSPARPRTRRRPETARMQADRIRSTFREFFEQHDHLAVASAPLVAPGDPTLLFTSAGMVPFKPYFMGQAAPPQPRLTSTQKCFRTTDIDEVGDESHLTFFEMMGNFSLGDYFKAEAQAWAWDLVTKVVGVPADRLVTTVFLDDDVAHENWRKIGVPEDRIYRYGEDQGNYWFSGLNGPCGPCSEIHYDLRPDGSHPGPAADEDRYLEIWNLVFMQFLQNPDGSRTPLPKQNIDTGAGLERWAMMLQDTPTLYETDVFAPLLAYVAERCARDYATAPSAEQSALRVVVEHGRSMTFLVSDGVLPSNEGRGYVLRRLIRRALYMAHTLGIQEPLLVDVAAQVRGHMGDAYPEIRDQAALVDNVLAQEEQRFRRTLETGHTLLEEQTIPLKRFFAAASAPFFERARAAAGTEALAAVATEWRDALAGELRGFSDLRNRPLADLSQRLALAPGGGQTRGGGGPRPGAPAGGGGPPARGG